MNILYWSIIMLMFTVAFIGLIYPIIPSVLFIVLGFILYGVFFTFESFTFLFWVIQGIFLLLLLSADYISNVYGIKRRGGSKAAVWGSTLGLLIGPFVLSLFGVIIGPFLGAVIGEKVFGKKTLKEAVKVGVGSLFAFLSSTAAKTVIQAIMIGYFFITV
ncbi:DUF456 domain-containing protein [Bacillus taeanensis]|uniref:DUF456 domain-containing protein n=1 Tax=Bacillus taeanensis TaxID=273032 RepID=A0A366Y2V7_9BACI|nr:DUF456 domain-containing protein [Bacillus taeanensis]RBW70541.1 DUF456 domain-containing protein [Bacillus taeanensis]